MPENEQDLTPCFPERPSVEHLNANATIPFGVSAEHVFRSMMDFVDFLQTVDAELVRNRMARLEDILMPANFSSMVGEFITSNLPEALPGSGEEHIPQRPSRPASN